TCSMSQFPENLAYQKLREARIETGEEWPEPATSTLYNTLVRGAGNIGVSVIGHHDPHFACEIATRTLLRLGSFRGTSQFSTWFYRIARNEYIRSVTERRLPEEQFPENFEPATEP